MRRNSPEKSSYFEACVKRPDLREGEFLVWNDFNHLLVNFSTPCDVVCLQLLEQRVADPDVHIPEKRR